MTKFFDLAVIGGGINGCGIAADAALRGLSVVIIEKGDIASKTSSNSSKLIHGGLRYLEHYNFSLVKKALNERQILLALAPHLIEPLPFILPYLPSMRPMWLLRSGLFLYDNLSHNNKLPKSKLIKRHDLSLYFSPLKQALNKGFLFYDCNTDDARLTLANALQAKEHGGEIYSYTALTHASAKNGIWNLHLCNLKNKQITCQARAVVNATGPWVEPVNQLLGLASEYQMSLIKGSHIVVHKLYKGNHAYLLQNHDKRVVFVMPYYNYSLIGTTDIPFKGERDQIDISMEEIDYLLKLINLYFNQSLTANDIVFSLSGVRPLIAQPGQSPQEISRDYTYHFTSLPAPAITIYGGKITTYRQLARESVNQLKAVFPNISHSSTHKISLPGAMFYNMSYKDYTQYAYQKYQWLSTSILNRLLKTYGTRLELFLSDCNNLSDLGQDFGYGLFQRELDYLREQEWAMHVDDVLWRRTKLGLSFNDSLKEKLAAYFL